MMIIPLNFMDGLRDQNMVPRPDTIYGKSLETRLEELEARVRALES